MVNFLIDLHNHLISNGELKKSTNMKEYILKRCENDVSRIFAFTDHFKDIKNQFLNDKLKKYKKLYDRINENNTNKYKYLVGLEIDVQFDFNIRHIIVIFKDFQSFYKKIEDFLDGDENRDTCFIINKDNVIKKE